MMNSSFSIYWGILGLILFIAQTTPCKAEATRFKFGLGVNIGYWTYAGGNSPSQSGNITEGLEFLFRWDSNWELALDLQLMTDNRGSALSQTPVPATMMVEGNFHPSGLSPLYFGLRGGLEFLNLFSSSNSGNLGPYFALGTQAGYEFNIPWIKGLNIGPKLILTYSPGVSSGSTLFSALGSLRYFF